MPNPDLHSFSALRARLDTFDAIIDARSEAEFAEDHLPGALNHPTLDTAERAIVGTLYKENSFEARKVGATLAARNIARHIETSFAGHPQNWKPLVYCWRGGQRSSALAHVLARVGWHVTLLEGGYKAFRRAVLDDLDTWPAQCAFRIICGPTGSGKSRLLRALAERGEQVLDLEELARHRGSVLGGLPDAGQPSQKAFETSVWNALRRFNRDRPVWAEAESRHIGKLRVPEQLMLCMRTSPCVTLDLARAERVALLIAEYQHLIRQPELLQARLAALVELHGHAVIDGWNEACQRGAWNELVSDLLTRHYDPAYRRSTSTNYTQLGAAPVVSIDRGDDASFKQAAAQLANAPGLNET